MGSFVGYQCSVCGKTHAADYQGYVCDSCGGNLNVILDYEQIKKTVKPEDIFSSDERSLWRYLPLLPVEDPGFKGTALRSAGLTPVYRTETLAKKAGVGTLWVKDEGRNPTASFKDRASSILIARAKQIGAETIATASTGNAGAALAGIRVFATGGIGGVHRGATETMDLSADLEELGRTSVAVVCAGAKSILDIGLTLEYLETKGVPVIGYGTDEMPAFYTRRSGFGVDYRMDSPKEIADAINAQRKMGYPGGMLITDPIPAEYAMPKKVIDAAIEQALKEAAEQGIKGKATTPFLLARVCELTGGESLKSNIKLVLNNVALAAQIAAAL